MEQKIVEKCMEYAFDSFKDKVEIPTELYKRIQKLVCDFDKSSDNSDDEDYLSDGEWLDQFFDVCLELTFIPMIKELTRWGYIVIPRKTYLDKGREIDFARNVAFKEVMESNMP